ncbi:hypothetical protein J6590_103433 [Homalodisca vitripennis]|nr:hypothetical protein J6590_103433 [Homalodisca vitripennis]
MDAIARELHKPARRNYPRRKVTLKGLNDLYQADLVEMIPHSRARLQGGATGLLPPPPENQARMAKIRHFTRDLGPRTESAKARGLAGWLGLTRDTSLLVPRPSRRARLQEDAALPLPPALPQPRPGSARL